MDQKCEVCGRAEPEIKLIGVASSTIGPISFAKCGNCADNCAEPKWLIHNFVLVNEYAIGWATYWDGKEYVSAENITVTDEERKEFWEEYEAERAKNHGWLRDDV